MQNLGLKKELNASTATGIKWLKDVLEYRQKERKEAGPAPRWSEHNYASSSLLGAQRGGGSFTSQEFLQVHSPASSCYSLVR